MWQRRDATCVGVLLAAGAALANDPLYDFNSSPLVELTDANFAETVGASRNCAPHVLPQFH